MVIARAVRSIALASLCTLSMLLAHLLGGGDLTLNWLAPSFLFVSFGVFYSLNSQEFSGPVLATVLLIFQLAGHVALGASHSDSRMSCAHGLALFVSFHVVRHFEALVSRVESFFCVLRILTPTTIPLFETRSIFAYRHIYSPLVCLNHLFERAPPILAAL